jgi:hypothetical protein
MPERRGLKSIMKLFVVTATRLRDGAILWLGEGREWHEQFGLAQAVPEAEIEAGLDFGAQDVAAQRVIGVYRVEVEVEDSTMSPVTTRERIRASGPSVRPDLRYAPAQSRKGA